MKKSDKINYSKIYLAIIIVLLLIIVVLIGFLTRSNNKINGMTKQEIFENNLKCQVYLDEYKDELRAKGYTDISVFYSPIENNCFGTFESYKLYNNDVWYNHNGYTIEDLSDIHNNVYFSTSRYYSGDDIITINHMTNTLTDTECSDIDYRNYYNDKEYYDNINRCKFDNAREAYKKELEYLKGN